MAKHSNLGGALNIGGPLIGQPKPAPGVLVPAADGSRIVLPQVAVALISDNEKAAIAMQAAAFMLQELERRGLIPPETPPDGGLPTEGEQPTQENDAA